MSATGTAGSISNTAVSVAFEEMIRENANKRVWWRIILSLEVVALFFLIEAMSFSLQPQKNYFKFAAMATAVILTAAYFTTSIKARGDRDQKIPKIRDLRANKTFLYCWLATAVILAT